MHTAVRRVVVGLLGLGCSGLVACTSTPSATPTSTRPPASASPTPSTRPPTSAPSPLTSASRSSTAPTTPNPGYSAPTVPSGPITSYSASELPTGFTSTCALDSVAVFVANRIVNLPLTVDCPGEIGGVHPPTVVAAVGESVRFRVAVRLDLGLAVTPATAATVTGATVTGATVTVLRAVAFTITARALCAPGADGKPKSAPLHGPDRRPARSRSVSPTNDSEP